MSTLNVVRYTALFSGIVYGFVHNRTLYKEAEDKKAKAAIKQRESWIEQAKKEYAQKQQSSTGSTLRQLASSATGGLVGGDSLITDPEDPKFDLEKLIQSWEKSS
ncbi:hypothetical protein P389DRAFT_166382 [Cystobasidium minutum MCA 4210]|uniref:uncharacterized protein n=1 Tax=Cystobasidium minutum MCA 4210 TaxID=1397322 RepID=UPI0034D003F2|eukprot:jgi/Rhomi1/166382/fgenesh1_kg.1_\